MLRKTLLALAALALVLLAVPVLNLFREQPSRHAIGQPMMAPRTAVLTTLDTHCADCHDPSATRPFYGRWPRARDVMEKDVAQGLAAFDLDQAFASGPRDGAPEVTLARLEHVVRERQMPPGRYVALHWQSALARGDRETLLSWIHDTRARYYAPPALPVALREGPVFPLRAAADLDVAKVALGRRLFQDVRLSGDGTTSCSTCHVLAHGGSDRRAVSRRLDGNASGVNTPTVFNAALQSRQTWAGSVPGLEAQCAQAVVSPLEMAASWEVVLPRLTRDKALVRAMRASYAQGLTAQTVADALAVYGRSLATPNSRFDRYLLGQEAALDAAEKRGYHTFVDVGCATCHVGQALGGQSVERRGSGYFKVPMLRNVAVTGPYFHDGSEPNLRPAVAVMGAEQRDARLTQAEIEDVTAFLRSLTGEFEGRRLD
jgi:cytochrome c peroxidase